MKRLPITGLVLVASPAILLGVLILAYGVDVPYWDQWSVMGLAEAFHLHVLTFSQLFAQYNEDRLVFPRLVLLGINALGRGNVKYQMLGTLLLVILVMCNVLRLARRTVPDNFRWLLVTLASLLIFSPIQYENWLWGNQLSNLMPVACLTTALAVSYSNSGPWLSFFVAATLTTVATFSYPNGTIVWALLAPVLLQKFESRPSKLRPGAIWTVLAGLNLAVFFYHYRFLGEGSIPGSLLAHKEMVVVSILALVGSPLSFGTGLDAERVAHFVGTATLLLAGVAFLRFIEVRRRPGMLWRSMPWLAIGGYALATGVLVTIGRATSSLQRLLESRYTAFSVYLFVALIFLWPIVFEEARLRPWISRFLIFLLLVLHVCTAGYAIGQMKETRTDRLQSKACLAFFNLIDDPCQAQRLDGDPVLLRQRVQSLERLGFFHPTLVKSPDLRLAAGSTDPFAKQYGVFESLVNVGNGFYRASGWATLPYRSGPADAVVLSYERADGAPVAFAMADWMKARDGVDPSDRASGWQKWFKLPPRADRIQAWAYDALAGHAFLLFGEQRASHAPLTSVRFAPQARGFLETVESGDGLMAKGWAVLLSRHKPADMVLLTCGEVNAISAAGEPWAIRPDVARELGDVRYLKSSWQIPVRHGELRAGCELKAWAYDAATNEAGLLPDLHRSAPARR